MANCFRSFLFFGRFKCSTVNLPHILKIDIVLTDFTKNPNVYLMR